MKPPTYSPREQEVLERPAGYKIHVYTGQSGRKECSKLFTAAQALEQAELVEKLYPSYRALVYAVRYFGEEREERMAHVTKAHLSALIQLTENQ